MRLSIPVVAQHQWEDAMLDAINDDLRVRSFIWITLTRAADGHMALFARPEGRPQWEPGRNRNPVPISH